MTNKKTSTFLEMKRYNITFPKIMTQTYRNKRVPEITFKHAVSLIC